MAIPAPPVAPYVGTLQGHKEAPGKGGAFPRRGDDVRCDALRLLAAAGQPVPGGALADALQVDADDLRDLLAYLVAQRLVRYWVDFPTVWWSLDQPRQSEDEPDPHPFVHRVVHVAEPSTIWRTPACEPSN